MKYRIDWKRGIEIRRAWRERRGWRGLIQHLTTISGWRIRNARRDDATKIDTDEQRRVDRFGPVIFITVERRVPRGSRDFIAGFRGDPI